MEENEGLDRGPYTRFEAQRIQDELASCVDLYGSQVEPKLIAAVDTAYGQDGDVLYACATVTTFPEIEEVERSCYHGRPSFPYVPGLLFFREGPIVVGALEKLTHRPDIVIVHGHGIAHPQRCGMACHVGITLDIPTIGCARRILAGRHGYLATAKGSSQPIDYQGREVGVAFRSKDNVKPIYISPGYRCDIQTARDIVVRNLRGFRLPEPLRLAHLFVNKYKRKSEKKPSAQRELVSKTV